MAANWWAVEKQIPGGTDADWVEICRCDNLDNVCAVIRAIIAAREPPTIIRVRQVPAGA